MILVVLGTEKYPFTRPLVELDSYLKGIMIQEEVVVQAGYTEFKSTRMKVVPFFNLSELKELYKEARVVISHGGTGSVVTGVKLGKKVIVIPRLKQNQEHIDDHQLELVEAFSESNYILPWYEGERLVDVFDKLEGFSPSVFVSGRDEIVGFVDRFISGV